MSADATPMCQCGRAAIDFIHDNPETYRPFAHAVVPADTEETQR